MFYGYVHCVKVSCNPDHCTMQRLLPTMQSCAMFSSLASLSGVGSDGDVQIGNDSIEALMIA
jgi:hypothetical protein